MKPSTTNEIEGKLHETKGILKEKAGVVLNDPDLQSEGRVEHLAGIVQKKLAQITKVFEK